MPNITHAKFTQAYAIESANDFLFEPSNAVMLNGIIRGVERETLRANDDGSLALTPHPGPLGATLSHTRITTDFSESLLEFITPPQHRRSQMFQALSDLHQYTSQILGQQGEVMWPSSMPCQLPDEAAIPIAKYGASYVGKMKETYRMGLAVRYGKQMQMVAGVHYNFSLPSAFWSHFHSQQSDIRGLSDYKDVRYFALIRNFRRFSWLLMLLNGASPITHESFVTGRRHNLQKAEHGDLLSASATSLRMGGLGYQSSAQSMLNICYNQKTSYVQTLCQAINTPWPDYEKAGEMNHQGVRQQLNSSLIQIENEFYSSIRPKRVIQSGETAIQALRLRGCEYIEVRCLDVNPFSEIGISAEQSRFLDVFLTYCALKDSPECDLDDQHRIQKNYETAVTQGRDRACEVMLHTGEHVNARDAGLALIDSMRDVAQAFDKHQTQQGHIQALDNAAARLRGERGLLADEVVEHRDQHGSYLQSNQALARQHKQALNELLNKRADRDAMLKAQRDLTRSSLANFASIEAAAAHHANDHEGFEAYLARYFSQYSECSPLLFDEPSSVSAELSGSADEGVTKTLDSRAAG